MFLNCSEFGNLWRVGLQKFSKISTYILFFSLIVSFFCSPNLSTAMHIDSVKVNDSTVNSAKFDNFSSDAWDFQDHTVNHPDLTTLSNSEIESQLEVVNKVFHSHNLPMPQHIAYPNGAYDERVINIVKNYRLSGRIAAAEGRYPETYPISNWYTLCTINMAAHVPAEPIMWLIDEAVKKNGLVNLFTHSVRDPPHPEGTTPDRLKTVLDYLVKQQNAGNLLVLTMSQAYEKYDGTKAVVVFSFDDSSDTDYTIVWPMFKALGLVGTSYITSFIVDLEVSGTLNWTQIYEMANVPPPEPTDWTITVSSTPLGGGKTTPGGYNDALQMKITSGSLAVAAEPNIGYAFSHWVFNGKIYSHNPLFIPAQENGTNHNLVAIFSKTMNVTVDADRQRYTKWSYVHINTKVVDTINQRAIENALVTVEVYDTHNRLTWIDQDITNVLGNVKFTYKLLFNAQMGNYTIKITVEKLSYLPIRLYTTVYSLG